MVFSDQFLTSFAAGFLQKVMDMEFDRAFRNEQRFRDLGIGLLRQQQADAVQGCIPSRSCPSAGLHKTVLAEKQERVSSNGFGSDVLNQLGG